MWICVCVGVSLYLLYTSAKRLVLRGGIFQSGDLWAALHDVKGLLEE